LCAEESMTICSAVLIQYQRVTDRRTDVQPIAKTCIADAREKINTRNCVHVDKNLKLRHNKELT